LNPAETDLLQNLGAVYVRKLRHGRSLLNWSRRIEDGMVRKGSLVRVYLNPRRFWSCYIRWKDRILFQDDSFLVVDKPAWIPFQPTKENFRECVVNCASDAVEPNDGRPIKLFGIHRLDLSTSGVLVLGKTSTAASNFHRTLRDFGAVDNRHRDLDKIYLAVTEQPVAIGELTHWMCPQSMIHHFQRILSTEITPQMLSNEEIKGFKKCSLEVLSCEKIIVGHNSGSFEFTEVDSILYESRIRLLSGRRHQIRCQFAAIGAPLIHDSLYTPMSGLLLDKACPRLTEYLMDQQDDIIQTQNVESDNGFAHSIPTEVTAERELLKSRLVFTKPPNESSSPDGIGLQSHSIRFFGRYCQAPDPWWRRDRVV
jgi:23S rRNA-/tRNA-specific pseudouridylate synthase